ncbi:GNAT family N-acetyltransferase [Sphaerisporangium corydalis]|uniref:GNAT family N-acetyltransferase n=1 Tax=Sphaerisporangium corydalis TaxID=1441875 RepID=A0ABV9EDP6_9ACTN|nr:GNAT family N-acetyltransferase [Sphaerisporangium corydalis]
MLNIGRPSPPELAGAAKELAGLMADVVHDGASVGFLAPLAPDAAVTWWENLVPAVAEGHLIVWVARDDDRVLGTVQLKLERIPNGRHRGEVAKLMVHPDAQGRGLGRRLLAALEQAAADAGLTLLLLDTETGSPAEHFYRTGGWTESGAIPAYAQDTAGTLRSTTIFYKLLDAPHPR